MWEQIKVTLRAGVRSHSFRAIALLAVLLVLASWFAGTLSGRHPQTVALDVGLSCLRLVLTLLVVFWVQELLGREMDRRTVFFSLAYPRSRAHYLLGRYFGIAGLLGLSVLLLGLSLAWVVNFLGRDYGQAHPVAMGLPLVLTLLLIWLDCLVVLAFSVFIGSFSSTSLLPFGLGLGFAVAARGIGSVQRLLHDPLSGAAKFAPKLDPLLNVLTWVLPDLGRLDVRELALYADPVPWRHLGGDVLLVTAYAAMLLILACWVFQKKEFE